MKDTDTCRGTTLAYRQAHSVPRQVSVSFNDYGLELLSDEPLDPDVLPTLLDAGGLLDDVLHSINAAELSMRRFREIARVSGLVFPGFPGANKTAKQLQASSSLFFEVFRKHDPSNLLLTQAEREVLRQEYEIDRLAATLDDLRTRRWDVFRIARVTPFAMPLLVERFRERISTRDLQDRLQLLLAELDADAGPP